MTTMTETSSYDDQVRAAIRDAGAWVDTNEIAGDYMPAEDAPPGYQALARAFKDSRPEEHQPCEHLASSGPQVAHWFTTWPGQAFCSPCAAARLKHRSRITVCDACDRRGKAVWAELTTGNLVIHGRLCKRCAEPGEAN
jgi:hypothetical protein